jgi:hypothetical protein
MVYQFTILSDESDDFLRVIEINAEAVFFELHEAILKSANYSHDQITSFFLCTDGWEREQEVTLMEMDVASEYDNLVMDSTVLEDYITDEGQRLQYVFDMMFDRAFFIELTEIITGKTLEKAVCVEKTGKAPEQMITEEQQTVASKSILDDDFYGDDDFDMDELDAEGFGDVDFDDGGFENRGF